jgi:S1-C subfamily serine protease
MSKRSFPTVYLLVAAIMVVSLAIGAIGGAVAGGLAGYSLANRYADTAAVTEDKVEASTHSASSILLDEEIPASPHSPKTVIELAPVKEPPRTQTQVTIESDGEDLLLQNIYDRVSPSVVNIQVTGQASGLLRSMPDFHNFPDFPDIPGLDERFREFLEQFDQDNLSPDSERDNGNEGQQEDSAPQEFLQRGEGSGFVFDKVGHLVTNNHVVEGAQSIRVTFFDDVTVTAELVGADPDSDLAVIKVDPKGLELIPLALGDSMGLKVGQRVIAIGNPFGLNNTMTTGIVSALSRSIPVGDNLLGGVRFNIPDIIQTDAAINPGNSGGPLLNSEGEVVGVNTAIESPVRASAGIGFAVPSEIVKRVIPVLIDGKDVEHPWLGISGTTLNPQLSESMDLAPEQRGVLVIEVSKDSPSEEAGLLPSEDEVMIDGMPLRTGGDVIIGIDDAPVRKFDDLLLYLTYNAEVGQDITVTLLRDGEQEEAVVVLADRPELSEFQETFSFPEPEDEGE